MKKFDTPKHPLPDPLIGSAIGSFAHYTVIKRFPKIALETIKDNEFPPKINRDLEQLVQDIPFEILREPSDLSAPDIEDWQNYLQPHLGKNWLEVPWFVAEMYFYRRILEATGFHQSGEFQGYDPFRRQKQRVLESAGESTRNLGDLLEKTVHSKQTGSDHSPADLQQLLVLDVWGNQADLSMWSAGENRPDHRGTDDQKTHLLVDDAEQVVDYLSKDSGQIGRVDFILDNYGPEIIHDIGLADYLLSMGLVAKVRFHAKPTPHYVSDAMIKDVFSTLEYLGGNPEQSVKRLANRIKGFIQEQRLEIKDDYFWTSPCYFWEMPDHIYQELSASDLVISKGDANYRRLAGDLNWPPTTPFQDVVRYFPTSILALRVLKAELALGLAPQQVNQLENQDPKWKINGNWAVIQFSEM